MATKKKKPAATRAKQTTTGTKTRRPRPQEPATPEAYIAALDEPRRTEILRIHELIRATVPKLEPHMAAGMIGYGPFHYKYASGREGDWFRLGLASQKSYISLYATGVIDGAYVAEAYRDQLPKASIGRSCIRFKRLDDLDLPVLKEILRKAATADFGTWGNG